MHGAMEELLSKSNEAQIKDKEPSSAANVGRSVASRKTPETRRPAQNRPVREPQGEVRGQQNMQNVQRISEERARQRMSDPSQVAPRVQTTKENIAQVAAVKPQPQTIQAAPIQNTPLKKRRRAKKSVWQRASVYVSVLALVAVGAIIGVIYSKISKAPSVPDTCVGTPVQVSADAPEFKIKEADDSKHDGRNYVTINVFEGKEMICSTGASTVGRVLEDMNVTIEGDYVLRENEEDVIMSDKVISIDKVTYGTITEETAVPFETKYVDVQTIARGRTQVVRAGANGVSTATFKVTYVNGVESERVLVSQIVTTQPTTKVVNRGVGGTITIGGKTYSYSHYIDCKTTVYTGGGITASGLPATEAVIAVDPRVIPLGTKAYVADSYWYVGVRTAADTGGAIKGNFIDIYMDENNPYLWGYGVRRARVYILD